MHQDSEHPNIEIGLQLGYPPKMKKGGTDHRSHLSFHSERRVQMDPQVADPILGGKNHPPKKEREFPRPPTVGAPTLSTSVLILFWYLCSMIYSLLGGGFLIF